MSDRWTQVTPSEFPWERDALAHLRAALPDRDPYRAYANFEFILDGAIGEVDTLVIAPKGIFLIEIKSWPGKLQGDAGTWRLTRPNELRARSFDNPLLLTNRKAKRLKSLLGRQKAVRGTRLPFIAPLVFLSHPELDCQLDPTARDGVHGLDGETGQSGGLTGIVAAFTRFTAEEHARLANRKIDRDASAKLVRALEQAGVRPSQSRRQVADLALGDLLDEGPGYQDFDARHPKLERSHRRVRIYGASSVASHADREQLSRAAAREFELLDAVSHPGIINTLDWRDHELGPALVFERDPTEIRLDHFLAERGDRLGLGDRLELTRKLAEAVAHAHSRRLFHRALSPRSVIVVRPDTPDQHLSILNWQAGLRDSSGTLSSTVTGTRDVDQLVDVETSAYLAPEALSQPGADPELLDVFSLGAIAFHVFAGRPAANTLAALVETLERDGALEIGAALDGAGANIAELVRQATAADARNRLRSVSELLELLDYVEEEITAPPEAPPEPEEPEAAKPEVRLADATRDARLGEFVVERRLGRGSTAFAFLVTTPDASRRVLKVAVDPDRNDRIRDEGEVLTKLSDPSIIGVHGEPVDVQGSLALLLSYASEGTLASRLQREGRLGLETLERWGADLLAAIAYLERSGIPHRDIKPDNLGIIERGRNHHRHLVLMDFSLSRAPANQVRAGTPAYIDPFLGTSQRPRFDLAAERYAAAIVLHEMATGSPPRWGDGSSDPRMIDDEITINRDSLPREIAAPLGDLLGRALRRDARERFDTADDMRTAWRRIFSELDRRPETEGAREGDAAELRALATLDTSLSAIGLSARAASALEPLETPLLTVEDLLAYPIFRLNRLPGVGMETREELRTAYHDLRARLGTQGPSNADADAPARSSLEALTADLLPAPNSRNAPQLRILKLLLGLEPLARHAGPWPSQTDVAAQLSLTRARVGQVLNAGRKRWLELPDLTDLRDELLDHLTQLGGIATAEELERAIATTRRAGGDEGLTRAAARAGVETELATAQPRLLQRRHQDSVLLADARDDALDAGAALGWAVRLGERADQLAGEDTMASSDEVVERLRALRPPPALGQLGPERLVRLAAAASRSAAASGRLELHPRDLGAERALDLGRGVLLGARELGVSDMRMRLSARFPNAAPLPDRPALDELLAKVGIELEWDPQERVYRQPERTLMTGETSYESSLARLPTTHVTSLSARPEPEVAEAAAFEERLANAGRDGGLLVLMTEPAQVNAAARELERFSVSEVDLDALILRQLHAVADDRKVRWDLVLRADASDRASRDWQRLTLLVEQAMPSVESELAATEGTVLLRNLGLLARYGHLSLIGRLRDRANGAGALNGCWLLVPSDAQADRPAIDDEAVPVLTPNEHARIPRPWLQNLHRSRRAAAGQGAA